MSQARELIHPRDEIMRTMERIYRYRMTTTSGGNLSILDDDGSIWITPARLDKGNLRRDDIVRVGPDGTHEGPHRPSSEFPFHRAIYEARPDIRGIVHAHPVALVAFSICRKVPDTNALHQARRICGAVGFAPYALPGSAELGRNVAATFATGTDCVILENHGVVIGGAGLQAGVRAVRDPRIRRQDPDQGQHPRHAQGHRRGRDQPHGHSPESAPGVRPRAGHRAARRSSAASSASSSAGPISSG